MPSRGHLRALQWRERRMRQVLLPPAIVAPVHHHVSRAPACVMVRHLPGVGARPKMRRGHTRLQHAGFKRN